MNLIPYVKQNPRILFLFDGIGAVISALSLAFLLAPFPEFFGIPSNIAYSFTVLAFIFAIYSLSCYWINPKIPKYFLRIIAIANFSYCILSLSALFFLWSEITIWGTLYILGEKLIVLSLVYLEIKVSKNAESNFLSVYTNTDYWVNGFVSPIHIGEIHSEINQLLIEKKLSTFGYLTAWNPRSIALSDEVNQERNQNLHNELEKIQNITIFKGIAESREGGWQAEESFLILGITCEQMEQLSQQFEQNAYLFGEIKKEVQLIFTKL